MDSRFARVAQLGAAQLERVFGELAQLVAHPSDAFGGVQGPGFAVWNPNPAGRSPVEVAVEVDASPGDRTPRYQVRDLAGRRLPTETKLLEPAADLMDLRIPRSLASGLFDREFPDFMGHELQDLSWEEQGDDFLVRLHLGAAARPDSELRARRAAMREAVRRSSAQSVRFSVRTRARLRLRFVDQLPAYGLRTYRAHPGSGSRSDDLGARRLEGGGVAIENCFWRVEADPAGAVTLVHSGGTVGEQRVEDALRLVSEGDRGDEYNFDPVPGAGVVDRPERAAVSLERGSGSGPSAAIRIRSQYRVPRSLESDRGGRSRQCVLIPAEICLRLWSGLDRVDLEVELDNRASDHRLRLQLGAPFQARRFQVESAFEIAEREIGPLEASEGGLWAAERPIGATPQRCFSGIDDGNRAATVAVRGLAEVEALTEKQGGSSLAITLLRAVGWLSRGDLALRPSPAGPLFETPGAQVPGIHRVALSLRWHQAGAADRVAEAHRFAHPPVAIQAAGDQDAPLRDGAQLLDLGNPEVVVSAIEPRPGGRSLIRLYNSSDRPQRVELDWRGGGGRSLEPVDLAERPAATPTARPDAGGRTHIQLRPWQIACLRTS
jgi:hypothetical protein